MTKELTKTEQKIMFWVCKGYNSEQISLKISKEKRTIEGIRRVIMKKLKAKNPIETAIKYYKTYDKK